MAKHDGLKGLPSAGITELAAKGIKNIDVLWTCVGEHFEGEPYDEGIRRVVQHTQISSAELTNFLGNRAISEAKQGEDLWLKRHWLDVLVIAGCISLFALGWRAIGVLPL
jgi:hypothetical protein